MATNQPTVGGGGARRAIVKSVNSGDTLLIQDLGAVDGPNVQGVDKQITLSSISAPRLARPKFNDQEAIPDQPFAWESREFLRKKCIGKKILYRVEHTANGRDYCTVKLPESSETLNSMIVSEGWANVLENKSKQERPELVEMATKAEEARAAGKGMHNKNVEGSIRDIPTTDAIQLHSQLKGKTLDGVVEQVRTGTSLRVTILPTFHNCVILLSGAQAPGFRRGKEQGEPDTPEPYAREAKTFVEQNALHRDVKVTIEGVDKNNFLLGSVECGGRDIAEELLKNGFAAYVAYSAVARGPAWASKLKAAEKVAKDGRKRLWTSYVERADDGPSGNSKEFVARVIGIVHAGTITVQPEGGPEQTINLAGVRPPRGNVSDADIIKLEKELNVSPAQAREAGAAERAWAGEAKEFLRKRLVGQKVKVVFEYVRKASQKENVNLPEKTFHSVYKDDANIAVALTEQGFVKVQAFPQGAERPADFELLLLAENKAKLGNRGWHGPPSRAPARRTNDLSVESDDPKVRANQILKAKNYLPHIQRNGPHKAVIDYVFSGGRYKVTIPAQSCTLSISLSGVKVPKRDEDATLSNEALQWARSKINQRDVFIDVDTVDKGGNFVGDVFTSKDNSFAVQLVNEGYAAVHAPTAERLRNGQALFDAEARAKKGKKNLWKNWDAAEEERKAAALAADIAASAGGDVRVGGAQDFHDVVVTEVLKGDRFYFQIVNAESDSLSELVQSLTDLSLQEGPQPDISPKVGDIVRAQFTEDDSWYRAKVTQVLPNNTYAVLYVDYGNSEQVPGTRIRALPYEYNSLPVQGREAGLAYIKAPSFDSEYGREAQYTLRELAAGKRLLASVEYTDGGVAHLCLADREANVLVNAAMVRQGVARVNRKLRRVSSNPTYVKLKEEEEKAKSTRTGMWQYGDAPDSDDDEDEPRGPRAWGKPAAKPAAAKEAPAAAPKKK